MMNERGDKIITRVNSLNSTFEIKSSDSLICIFYSSIDKDDWTHKSINFSRIFTMFRDEHSNKYCYKFKYLLFLLKSDHITD